jgi:hypothetical protein
MKILTKLITEQLHKQYQKVYTGEADYMDLQAVAKLFDPHGRWTAYLITLCPDDNDYMWCVVKDYGIEIGSVSLKEVESIMFAGRPRIERDTFFQPINVRELYERLNNGEFF